jgi:diguanylate cyclase (GGDEF)-like protein/PAS domain S-box-containing protein
VFVPSETKQDVSYAELLDDRYLLDALLEHSPDHLYFKDVESRFLRVSRSLSEWMGLADPLEAIGCTDADFFAREHAEKARSDEDVVLRTGRPIVGVEEREVWPDGRETWVSTTKAPLRNRQGRVIGIFGMSRDITARKAAEALVAAQAAKLAEQAEVLRDLASKDELTGVFNRRGFLTAAEAAMTSTRHDQVRLTMFLVDLDSLKEINDLYGHLVGDQALTAVAAALQAVAEERSLVGRIGGDEFCLLEIATETEPPLEAEAIASAIQSAATSRDLPALTASVGVTVASSTDDLAILIARSDGEMYARKARRSRSNT